MPFYYRKGARVYPEFGVITTTIEEQSIYPHSSLSDDADCFLNLPDYAREMFFGSPSENMELLALASM